MIQFLKLEVNLAQSSTVHFIIVVFLSKLVCIGAWTTWDQHQLQDWDYNSVGGKEWQPIKAIQVHTSTLFHALPKAFGARFGIVRVISSAMKISHNCDGKNILLCGMSSSPAHL